MAETRYYPVNGSISSVKSDLEIAIDIATTNRNEQINDLVDVLKNCEEATKEKIERLTGKILESNFQIRLMNDALVAVAMYKKQLK